MTEEVLSVPETLQWHWLPSSRYGGADGGTMGKLFRNRDSLSDTALLAREALQNSWDAAARFREQMADPEIPFSMKFRFQEYEGEERRELIHFLGLDSLAERRNVLAAEKDPLQAGSILDHITDDSKPLRLLSVEDYGTHGLYGHPDLRNDSHLFLAMYYIGGSNKDSSAGGSYGFGKSALERASRIRSVIAHSVFLPCKDDPVTSRLVGFTWWRSHRIGRSFFEGKAMLASGDPTGDDIEGLVPYEDEGANIIAERLHLPRRDPSNRKELGTSFVIVDPAINPDDLVKEIEKWWWPALEDLLFSVEVVDWDGSVLVPKPASNSFVAPFIPAYHIATGQVTPTDPNKQRQPSSRWQKTKEGIKVGQLGLVVPENLDAGEGEEQEPIVALMRSPRMVIAYQHYSRRRIPLRGAFVASEDANRLLRDTEPSSHDCWDRNFSADVPNEATQTARGVMERIARAVKDMAADIAPPPPRDNRSLTHFSRLLKGFMGGSRGQAPPPPEGGEPIELRMVKPLEVEAEGKERLVVSARFGVQAAANAPGSACLVAVDCRLAVNEDEHASTTRWPVSLRAIGSEHGFTQEDDGSWVGVIKKNERVVFDVRSDPYPNLWTTTLQPTVERLGEWSE